MSFFNNIICNYILSLKNYIQIIVNLIVFLIITLFWLKIIKGLIFSSELFETIINIKEKDLSDQDVENFLMNRMMNKIVSMKCCYHYCNSNAYCYN